MVWAWPSRQAVSELPSSSRVVTALSPLADAAASLSSRKDHPVVQESDAALAAQLQAEEDGVVEGAAADERNSDCDKKDPVASAAFLANDRVVLGISSDDEMMGNIVNPNAISEALTICTPTIPSPH